MNKKKRQHEKRISLYLSRQTNAMLDKPFTVFDLDFKPEYWWEKEEYDEYD